jgi:type II secretory pathway pseudopilin PulG
MLTVIAIVMVLMAIVLIVAGPGIYKQKTLPTCASNLRQIGMAYSIYYSDNDGWPMDGGLVGPPWWAKRFGFNLQCSCPLNPKGQYWDNYTESNYFPDGSPIPQFDPSTDVLARCLEHGYDGFDKGSSTIWSITPATKGRVLGVRADGSVAKVAPVSCWEFGAWLPSTIPLYPQLWRSCDAAK